MYARAYLGALPARATYAPHTRYDAGAHNARECMCAHAVGWGVKGGGTARVRLDRRVALC